MNDGDADQRDSVYRELHHGQLSQEEAQTRFGAQKILRMIRDFADIRSIVDVGCGLGTWMSVAQEMGIADVRGVEGKWLDAATLVVDRSLITICDLEARVRLGRRFDLAICLEVGEHLPEQSAENLVASLTDHADLILFSAAIPFQGGTHHVNERFASYWANLFARHQYHPVDCIRPRIWEDPQVLWWIRQNILMFANPRALERYEKLRAESQIVRALSIVHPELYLMRVQNLQLEQSRLMQLFSQGGTFKVSPLPDGSMSIEKI